MCISIHKSLARKAVCVIPALFASVRHFPPSSSAFDRLNVHCRRLGISSASALLADSSDRFTYILNLSAQNVKYIPLCVYIYMRS